MRWRIWFSLGLSAFSLTCLTALSLPVRGASEDTSVPSWMRKIHVGKPMIYRNLALYPVTGPERHLPPRHTLDTALGRGDLRVEELNEGGSVNVLTVENRGDRAVFILAGEILSGARQNRVLQHDLWLPPHSGKVQISVYCVEHGRWSYKGPGKVFQSNAAMSNPSVRAAARLEQSQGAVWKSVDDTNRAGGVAAPTQSLEAAYQDPKMAPLVDSCAHHFEDMVEEHPGMCGVVVQVGNRLTAVDLIPDHKLLEALWPKLVRSYALESRGGSSSYWEGGGISTDVDKAQDFLEQGQMVTAREIPHVGEGELVELNSNRFGGEALLLEDGPAHIDLFSKRSVQPPRPPHPYPHPNPVPTTSPSPWPPAQDLIRPHHQDG